MNKLQNEHDRDAAECYEKSWNFGNQAGAAAGFKLAFNYLKAKRWRSDTHCIATTVYHGINLLGIRRPPVPWVFCQGFNEAYHG